MDESAKRAHFEHLKKFVKHPGIDIGAGSYPPAYGFLHFDKKSPGYDGVKMPFPDEHFETVHSSHCLEHIEDVHVVLSEWFRILKTGGHLMIFVPHKYLYEKKWEKPSQFNKDHKRFYIPWAVLAQIDAALTPNTYRVVHLRDNDEGYDYSIPPKKHPVGCYEIECVIKKIQKPKWDLLP